MKKARAIAGSRSSFLASRYVSLLLCVFLAVLVVRPVRGQPCFGIADSDKITSSDELIGIDPAAGTSFALGSLGTLDVEAAALSLDGTILYAADGGQLGTVNTASGVFSALPSPVGSAGGSAGVVLLDDIDSLSFDPFSGQLYGVHRTAGAGTPDLLIRIDPLIGAHVADAFGPGMSYVEIPPVAGLASIDDIAIDPIDGQMYAIANDDPTGFADRLVLLDKLSGASTDVGALGAVDVEGLTFDSTGALYASSGADGPLADRDSLFTIDTLSGAATRIAPLFSLFTDYEAIACRAAATILGDRVWEDLNGSSIQDAGEPGLAGVAVELLDGGGGVVAMATTDADGLYTFAGLAAGDYRVRVTAPAGFFFTFQDQGGDETLDSDVSRLTGESAPVTLVVGETNTDVDAGLYRLVTVSGIAFEDVDGNGIQDGGEVGLEGPHVELRDAGGTLVAATYVEADGTYLFTDQAPGDYSAFFTALEGYTFSPQDQGADDTVDSDVDPLTGETALISLSSGESLGNVDAGLIPPPTEAVITSFAVHADAGRLTAVWETSSEIATAGFYLYRYHPRHQRYEAVHRGLLPSLDGAPAGGRYALALDDAVLDNLPVAGSSTFVLAEVEVGGNVRHHGPFEVEVEAGEVALLPADASFVRLSHDVPAATRSRLRARRAERAAALVTRDQRRGGALKIAITETGLYHLTAAEIALRLDLSAAQVEGFIVNGRLKLHHRGQPVAWWPAPGGSGLDFYGTALDSPYTTENVYWLLPGDGLLMAAVEGGMPLPAGGPQTFLHTSHVEEDRIPVLALEQDPEADVWHWASLSAGHPQLGRQTFDLPAEGVAASLDSAALTVHLMGGAADGPAAGHHALVQLNGVPVGALRWTGAVAASTTFTFPQALLREGTNEVELEGVLDEGVLFSRFYVQGFDLGYQRRLAGGAPAFTFRADANQVVTLAGYATPAVRVFDLSDPLRPRRVTGTAVTVDGGGYSVSFRPTSPQTPYLAVTPSGLRAPAAVWAAGEQNLRAGSTGADYLVIAPESLLAPAETLAAHRQSQGWEARVVSLEAVMDAFNHGIYAPTAIRAFLAHTHDHWLQPPSHVVLAGAGSYDYRDLLGWGDNLLPPMLVATEAGLFASDAPFADIHGEDGVPELAIGRLPVLGAGELEAVIAKMIATEQHDGAWRGRALGLADDPDAGGAFGSDSTALMAQLPAGMSGQLVDLGQLPLITARSQLFTALDNGVRLVTYLGHGGLDRFADEGLWTRDDAGAVANGDRLPIVAGLTCAANRFGIPGFTALGEALVTAADGGALAVWSASGLSVHRRGLVLAAGFLAAASQEDATLGEAILGAFNALAAQGDAGGMLSIYNLLGDPATPVANR